MSFATYTDIIQDQAIAIVYRRHDDIFPMTIRSGDFLNDKDGSYKHDDFIGQPWGSKVCHELFKILDSFDNSSSNLM